MRFLGVKVTFPYSPQIRQVKKFNIERDLQNWVKIKISHISETIESFPNGIGRINGA